MRLFDDLMNKAEKFADQAVKVGKEALDQTKVLAGEAMDKGQKKVRELSLESDMRDGYRRLGELVYKMAKTGTANEELKAQYIAELAEMEAELAALRNTETPEYTTVTVEKDEETVAETEKSDVVEELKEEAVELFNEFKTDLKEAVEDVKEMFGYEENMACPVCGTEAEEDDLFCLECGTKLK